MRTIFASVARSLAQRVRLAGARRVALGVAAGLGVAVVVATLRPRFREAKRNLRRRGII
eukprot:CAMPEP_0118968256 /NCGR_PEP_ID=MMETSP1173-20130426/5505_1 /TAXON_ID=1034831 /ORGANISM="Rhizochromulina marina cf, Strain CCMP1243" /LENGTH=58 /DNA_ID=CAMNT_0006917339 /DNA_START=84 /DNA_END=257 /DNA_ORIENTATION=+